MPTMLACSPWEKSWHQIELTLEVLESHIGKNTTADTSVGGCLIRSTFINSMEQPEIASTVAWVSVILLVFLSFRGTLSGHGFGLMALPIYDKLLLMKFIVVFSVVAGTMLLGHEVPNLIIVLLAWITLNQMAFMWWNRITRGM